MKKPALLRAAIVAMIPEFARDPDRLGMWVEKGMMRSTDNGQCGFAWEYDLAIAVENLTVEPAILFFAISQWLRDYQPSLLAANNDGIAFEVNVIDANTVDVDITIPLVEIVTAELIDGAWKLNVLDESVPSIPDDIHLRSNAGPLSEIWLNSDDVPFKVAPNNG